MKNRRQYDLIVFGAEPGGLAAAACAARAGATAAVIETGLELPPRRTAPSVPNFVWRQLKLHETDLYTEAASARISLFEGRDAVVTRNDPARNGEALRDSAVKARRADSALWADFHAELAARRERVRHSAVEAMADMAAPQPHLLTDAFSLSSMAEVLNDYFEDADLKTHLTAVAAMAFNLGGEEPGSAQALAATTQEAAWPVKNAAALNATLRAVCGDVGVDMHQNAGAPRRDGDWLVFEAGDGVHLAGKTVMACSVRLARAAGLHTEGARSALWSDENAEAMISVKLTETPVLPANGAGGDAAGADAVYYVAETPDEIRAARDAVLEGRTPENPPLMFELGDKEILVRAPYCPRLIMTDEGPREWTGQDKQVLGAQVLKRLGKHLNGALRTVQQTDVDLYGVVDLDAPALVYDGPEIAAPSPAMDEIGAAAALALRLVGREAKFG